MCEMVALCSSRPFEGMGQPIRDRLFSPIVIVIVIVIGPPY